MFNDFKNIGDVISKEKEFEKIRIAVEEQDVVSNFYEIFPELKKAVIPVKIEKKILFLRTENSVWRSELNFRKELLLKKINSFCGKELLKGIKFI